MAIAGKTNPTSGTRMLGKISEYINYFSFTTLTMIKFQAFLAFKKTFFSFTKSLVKQN